MQTVIFISNQTAVAAEGVWRKGTFMICRVCQASVPENSIINGVVTDEASFGQFLRAFWNQYGLARRNVILITGNVKTVSRQVMLPIMSHKKRMKRLEQELQDVRTEALSVCSYEILEKMGNMEYLFVNLVDSMFVKNHVLRFEKAGIRLKTMVMADMALVVLAEKLSCIRNKTCIIQLLDGTRVRNLLYVNGRYFHSNHIRLLHEPGTSKAAEECASYVEQMRQFLKTQLSGTEVSHVYLTGDFSEYDMMEIQLWITRHSVLSVSILKITDSELFVFETEELRDQIQPYLLLLGGGLLTEKNGNLLGPYRRMEEARSGYRLEKRILNVGMMWISFLMLALGFLYWYQEHMKKYAKELEQAYESCEWESVEEYDRLCGETDVIARQIEMFERNRMELEKRAVYDSRIFRELGEASSGLVRILIHSFDGNTGVLTVEIESDEPEAISLFVSRLCEEAVFWDTVDYAGFSRKGHKELWESRVSIHLLSGGEEHETADEND